MHKLIIGNKKNIFAHRIIALHTTQMSLTPQQRKRLAVYSFVRGFQYEHGLDVERDLNEAYKSYHTAAQLDHVDAIYACGK